MTVFCHISPKCFYCQIRNVSRVVNDDAVKKNFKGRLFDHLRIYVRGGAGGQGYPKFGGIGGRGGNVLIRAMKRVKFETLVEINPSKRYTAATGMNSTKRVLLGSPGEDQIVPVPIGVTISDDEGRLIGDLNEEGQEVIAAHGGHGGGPDNDYLGKKGEARSVTLDLKLIADIGLVGFPNAGKSTFLSAISRAKPKIAEYAFTTIRPQIGVMEYPDFRKITVADLPGLIEGAHLNFGMGHKFLKHLERTKLLLFMVDINGFQLSPQYEQRTAFETILLLNQEVELYNADLLRKPAVLALNKIDTDEKGKLTDSIVDLIKRLPDSLSEVDESMHPKTLIKFDEIYKISTMFDQNTETAKYRLRKMLDFYATIEDDRHHQELQTERAIGIRQREKPLGREHNRNKLV